MLVTQWLDHDNRETRDADILGFGDADVETNKAVFAQIMAITSADGLDFDTGALPPSNIRDRQESGGIRPRHIASPERTRINVPLDIPFVHELTTEYRSADVK